MTDHEAAQFILNHSDNDIGAMLRGEASMLVLQALRYLLTQQVSPNTTPRLWEDSK